MNSMDWSKPRSVFCRYLKNSRTGSNFRSKPVLNFPNLEQFRRDVILVQCSVNYIRNFEDCSMQLKKLWPPHTCIGGHMAGDVQLWIEFRVQNISGNCLERFQCSFFKPCSSRNAFGWISLINKLDKTAAHHYIYIHCQMIHRRCSLLMLLFFILSFLFVA